MKQKDAAMLLGDYLGNNGLLINLHYKDGTLTAELFEKHLSGITASLERVLESGIDGIPCRKIHDSYLAILRYGYEKLKQADYPKDIEKTIEIINSLYMIILRG